MNKKYVGMILAMGLSASVMAQENDDMYFTSKDRAKLNADNQLVLAKRYQQDDLNAVRSNPVNPSDSYSGRGINPEFNGQVKNGTTVVQNNPDYFLSGYQPRNVNPNLYNSPSSAWAGNNAFNNPYYGMGGFGGWGSPFSSFYSPFNNFHSPGLSMGLGYGWGGWNSGWGMGMGNMWGGPSSMFWNNMYGMNSWGMGMGSLYNSAWGWGAPWGPGYGMGMSYWNNWGGWGARPIVVVNNGAGDFNNGVSYGRRATRSSDLNNYVDNSRNDQTIRGTNGREREGGRMRTADAQPNYYDRGWRDNSSNYTNTNRGSYDNGSGTRSGWSGYDSNNTRSGWSGYGDGGRSRSSYDSFGSGGRSSFGGGGFSGGGGMSGGGGGGGGRSRGRN